MPVGTPVDRHWVIVLKDGTIAIDWGDGLFQDVRSGEFIPEIAIDWGDGLFQDVRSGEFIPVAEKDISHHVLNEELDWLIKIGRVGSYNASTVNFHSLPERPQRTIE